MTWVAWRQFRIPALGGLIGLATAAAFLVLTGIPMSSAFDDSGLAACLVTQPNCGLLVEQFRQRFAGLETVAPYFQFLPGLIGVFWGAPLVAREYEQGTDMLAFTQSVSRARWITAKLALVLTAGSIVTLVLARLLSWWYEPFAHLDDGRFTPEVFSHEGIVPVAYTLFAIALGVAAGTILRKTVPAMAVTLGVFFAVRFPIEEWLRPNYLRPRHLIHPAAQGFGTSPDDWNLSSRFVDSAGKAIPMQHVATLCPPGTDTPLCLDTHGFQVLETFHPASRFWTFQAIETSIFLVLTLALIGTAVYSLGRRAN